MLDFMLEDAIELMKKEDEEDDGGH